MSEQRKEMELLIKVYYSFLTCTLSKWNAFDHVNVPSNTSRLRVKDLTAICVFVRVACQEVYERK